MKREEFKVELKVSEERNSHDLCSEFRGKDSEELIDMHYSCDDHSGIVQSFTAEEVLKFHRSITSFIQLHQDLFFPE